MAGLRSSRARWNVLANQVMVAEVAQLQNGTTTFSMDKWGGYVAARKRLLDFVSEAKPSNPVVIPATSIPIGSRISNWTSRIHLQRPWARNLSALPSLPAAMETTRFPRDSSSRIHISNSSIHAAVTCERQ